MSYAAREISATDGAPIELYRFAVGAQHWTYTSGDVAVTWLSETYTLAPIQRGALQASDDAEQAVLDLEAPLTLPPAALFIAAPPAGLMTLTIYRLHRGDSEVLAQWSGRVAAAEYDGRRVRLRCHQTLADTRATRSPRPAQRQCPLALYSAACGANGEALRLAGSVTAITGATLTVPAAGSQADGWWVGGKLVADAGASLIRAHSGATLVLSAPILGLGVGDAVALYPGCDHQFATCAGKFANADNYGGLPWLPAKNPYSGDAPA